MAIIDFFDKGWSINPAGIAFVMGETEYSYDEARNLSCRIANALLNTGLLKETKVAVWSLNDPVAWICVLGIWRAGMTWVPINPRSSFEDNTHILTAFDCQVLFFQDGFGELVGSFEPNATMLEHLICLDAKTENAESLDTFIAGHAPTTPDISYDMDDVVMLGPTGGTTGMPKGVMNTHRNLQTFVAQYSMLMTYRPGDSVVNLAAAPMTHTAGNLSLPTSARGGTVVILTKPDPENLMAAIKQHGVTELFLPPTVIYALLNHPDIERADFSSLRYFLYGAAPMSIEKLRQAMKVFGPVMTEGYGQMEAFASIAYLSPEEHFLNGELAPNERLSSCGRPMPLVNVKILDDEGIHLPPNEPGEICVQGDNVMKGYYKNPEQTKATIINNWLHTGDIGYLDIDGYLHITDRKKDMIISGGFNVYPTEVEQVIWAHQAVQDCAVIGVPDPKWGEAVTAVVELKPGLSVSSDELIAICRERLGGVKTPKSVEFVEQLPRSANGKVLKKDVRAKYWRDAERNI